MSNSGLQHPSRRNVAVACAGRSAWIFTAVAALTITLAAPSFPQGPALKKAPTKAHTSTSAAAELTPTATPGKPELTASDLESFLDGLVPLQIERADIAGAVIAVVKDGKPLFAKGYGYSDYDKKIPISPENTLFRPGSISKLFTWTSVMQQVEEGKLDLDRDVNDYIDFKIPARFGKPITLRDIMTHRPGFEETVKDLFVGSAQELTPLPQYLPSHLPREIFPPGTTPAYSNYATTLAAYIVQRVTGQPFNDYVEQRIFKPLDMQRATFRQPLPDALKPLMSNGYQTASGGAKGFEFVEVAPAGALSISAESITHFMIAHLQNGHYGDAQILKPESAVQMHQRQQGWPPAMNAMCLGFYEESRNGQRIIGHGGDTRWFHSDLHLLLDANVGFFVSYNSAGKDDVSPRSVLFAEFMDRYFPVPPPNEPTLSTAAKDARSVAGRYELSRRFQTNVVAVSRLLGETEIAVDRKDSTIYTNDFKSPNGHPIHFREIGPLVFRDVNGQHKLAFVKDVSGRRVVYIDYPFMVLQQVRNPLNGKIFNYAVIFVSLGVIALTLLLWPVSAILRKHYGVALELSQPARRLRNLVHAVCFLVSAFVVGIALVVSRLDTPGGLGAHGDLWIHLVQVAGVLCGFGALVGVISAAHSWRSKQWRWYQVWNTLFAVACVGFFWFIYHWHLLNFHLNY